MQNAKKNCILFAERGIGHERNSKAEHMNTAIRRVSELSNKTREGIEALMKEIAQFKVE